MLVAEEYQCASSRSSLLAILTISAQRVHVLDSSSYLLLCSHAGQRGELRVHIDCAIADKQNAVVRTGPLYKKASRTKLNTKFWVVLRNDVLSWFESTAVSILLYIVYND